MAELNISTIGDPPLDSLQDLFQTRKTMLKTEIAKSNESSTPQDTNLAITLPVAESFRP
jgi:hypothetical protein